MTTLEHLEYFARIKGIEENLIPDVVRFYAQVLSLAPYLRVKAGVLSGGNKRKLCVAMAMIGNPKVMFFD
jgi:ATP-binding cassette subfamily A (ABC1) protein 3